MKFKVILIVAGILLNYPCLRAGDTIQTQTWFDMIVGHNLGNDFYVQADFRYEWLLADHGNPWHSFNINLLSYYYPVQLLDLSLEIVNSFTQQTSDLKSYESAQRIGVRCYILQRGHNVFKIKSGTDAAPKRFELSNYSRIEHRNFDYYGDLPPEDSWRFRNRSQLAIALNKKTFNENRMLKSISDIEFFIPFGSDVTERYVDNYRVRLGIGYRHSFAWRFELLYIFNKSKNNIGASFEEASNMLNFKLNFQF